MEWEITQQQLDDLNSFLPPELQLAGNVVSGTIYINEFELDYVEDAMQPVVLQGLTDLINTIKNSTPEVNIPPTENQVVVYFFNNGTIRAATDPPDPNAEHFLIDLIPYTFN